MVLGAPRSNPSYCLPSAQHHPASLPTSEGLFDPMFTELEWLLLRRVERRGLEELVVA